MKTILAIFTSKKASFVGTILGAVGAVAIPNSWLLILLSLAMFVDLITGLMKSWHEGKATTSSGLRKTAIKLGSYVSIVMVVWLFVNILSVAYKSEHFDYSFFVNITIAFLAFIELYSILENLYILNPKNRFFRNLVRWLMKFLKGRMDDITKNQKIT